MSDMLSRRRFLTRAGGLAAGLVAAAVAVPAVARTAHAAPAAPAASADLALASEQELEHWLLGTGHGTLDDGLYAALDHHIGVGQPAFA